MTTVHQCPWCPGLFDCESFEHHLTEQHEDTIPDDDFDDEDFEPEETPVAVYDDE